MLVLQEKGRRERIDLVQFSPDGQSLLTSSYDGTILWSNFPRASIRLGFPDLGCVTRARFTPDGRFLLTDRNGLTISDTTDGKSRPVELWTWWASSFDVTPDGRQLVVAQNDRGPEGRITCRPLDDLTPQAAVWSRELDRSFRSDVTCVVGERFVLTESWWDQDLLRGVFRYVTRSILTGNILAAVEGTEIERSVASSDGQLVAGLMNARVVVLSSLDFSKPVTVLRNDGRKHFTGIAFHPSGRYLAATSNDATVKLYDTATWELARTFTWDIGRMRSIAFSPDGTLAAAGSDTGKVVVWDVDV